MQVHGTRIQIFPEKIVKTLDEMCTMKLRRFGVKANPNHSSTEPSFFFDQLLGSAL